MVVGPWWWGGAHLWVPAGMRRQAGRVSVAKGGRKVRVKRGCRKGDVAERVAPHKRLGEGVMFVESLPKNQTGKLLRRELKAQVFKGSFGY